LAKGDAVINPCAFGNGLNDFPGFPDGGISIDAKKTKEIELLSDEHTYEEFEAVGELVLTHSTYAGWAEKLGRVPPRAVLYKGH
jgi:hypothetical protein